MRVYLGLGSNTDRRRHIQAALDQLAGSVDILRCSSVYSSPPVNRQGGDYFNLVACVETDLSPASLRQYLRAIETALHRERSQDGVVTVDIDILLYGDQVYGNQALNSGILQIPHPDIRRYAHVLVPLTDIAPDIIYPGSETPLMQLRRELALDETALQVVAFQPVIG